MRAIIVVTLLFHSVVFSQDILMPGDALRGGGDRNPAAVANSYIVTFSPTKTWS